MIELSLEYVNSLEVDHKRISKVVVSTGDAVHGYTKQDIFNITCSSYRKKCEYYLCLAKGAKEDYLFIKSKSDSDSAKTFAEDRRKDCWEYFNKFTQSLNNYYSYKLGNN